ncbi:MAG TPA: DNA cytosine methyltransferase [Ignavibacteriales bacterium]|nr:DNA cytosine methyltransferase [Ignavibacteriales bacterium]
MSEKPLSFQFNYDTEEFDLAFEGVDLFCGAGGTTSGVERAKHKGKKIAYVIAAVNHDPVAIASHASNHKKVKHFVEDIRTLDVTHLPKPRSDENYRSFLWASLECTNFSNAKGGGPRDADSRTLANHLERYVEYLMSDYILIENVREFLSWGPLCQKTDKHTGEPVYDKKGNPVMIPESRTAGKDFINWVSKICSYGYEWDYRILDSADFGAHTSRKRLFIIFARIGLPIAWPGPTHSKTGGNGLKKWKAVKEVLDFSDKGESIFNRKKPLVENTLKRIYEGLVKFGSSSSESFIVKYLSNDSVTGANPGKSVDEPAPVVTTQNRLALASIDYLTKYHGAGKNIISLDSPCSTITTKDRIAKVSAFTMTYYGGDGHVHDLENPANAITTKDHHAIIQTENFINLYYSSGKKNQSVQEPSGAVLPTPKQRLVSIDRLHFIDEQYGNSKGKSINEPAGSLTTNPKQNLLTLEKGWIMNTNYSNVGSSLEDPSPTIMASRRHFYLMNPQYASAGSSIENPCFTLIARMDKKPPYLVELENGELAIEILESDSPYTKKIKKFMAEHGIIDIYMRMLKVPELLKIQGFDDNYILKGNQSEQKKFIGNAVPPVLSKKLIEALHGANLEMTSLRKVG